MNSEYHRVVQQYGGTVAFSDCEPHVWEAYVQRASAKAHQEAAFQASPLKREWRERPILNAIINSDVVNVCAVPGIEADYILIYRGFMERVLGYALALFSTREFLPTIGDSSNELSYAQAIAQFGQHASLKTGLAFLMPRDPVRAACGLILSVLAVNCAVSHEIGHIVGGHFALLRNPKTARLGIDEREAQKSGLEPLVPLACLEWDADHYASALCWSILDSAELPSMISEMFSKSYADRHSAGIVIWSLAAHLFFRCLAVEAAGVSKFAPDKYPPPSLRGLSFMLDLLQRTAFVHGANPERDAEVGRFISQAEANFATGRDGVVLAGHDWFQNWSQVRPDWYKTMGRLFQTHRDQLEHVRRSEVTWRPIWREKPNAQG